MATAKVSKRTVDAMKAPAEGKQEWLWDDQIRGFGVVMSSSGRKVYVVQYRIGGQVDRRQAIADRNPRLSLDARRRARALEVLRMVETGVDPAKVGELAAEAAQEAARLKRDLGFAAFADRFIQKHVIDGELRSRRDIEGTFERDQKP